MHTFWTALPSFFHQLLSVRFIHVQNAHHIIADETVIIMSHSFILCADLCEQPIPEPGRYMVEDLIVTPKIPNSPFHKKQTLRIAIEYHSSIRKSQTQNNRLLSLPESHHTALYPTKGKSKPLNQHCILFIIQWTWHKLGHTFMQYKAYVRPAFKCFATVQ